ncbi:MAG: quinone-dependent dihydroorotate dehydrogenase [Cyanobacteria bacterium P01_C01_bin.89]
MDIYQRALRPLLFNVLKTDPEVAHNQSLGLLEKIDQSRRSPAGKWLVDQCRNSFVYADPRLSQTLWGLNFPNPMGLAAGFDKNGQGAGLWSDLGFGFAEMGTVTAQGQPGNPKPRLFRLPEDQAALNRMGFNNGGSEQLQKRLENHPHTINKTWNYPLGINLGKSKVTPLEDAAADYQLSFERLKALGDYFVVNVSSPNTPGLRSLQATDELAKILDALQTANVQRKPLVVKIAPDLADEDVLAVVNLAQQFELSGLIATNTTIRRDALTVQTLEATGNPIANEPGGISGAPVRQRSTEVIRLIYEATGGQLPIIGVGGIFTAEDAWEKITAGATLVQVYTGWIYEGPWMVKRILQGLAERLESKNLVTISEVIGIDTAVALK